MHYQASKVYDALPHDPLKALVSPRPIGWISSLCASGIANLAPYSFFNLVSSQPPMVMFSSVGMKDSVRNILETKEFVCNIAGESMKVAVTETSRPLAPEVDEFDFSGLEKAPSTYVKVPRVLGISAALECELHEVITLPGGAEKSGNQLVLGQVVGVYIDDAILKSGLVDVTSFRPLARLGYRDYCTVTETFEMTDY